MGVRRGGKTGIFPPPMEIAIKNKYLLENLR